MTFNPIVGEAGGSRSISSASRLVPQSVRVHRRNFQTRRSNRQAHDAIAEVRSTMHPMRLIFGDHAPSRMVASLALSSFGYICVGVSTEEDALLAVDRMAATVIAYKCHRPDAARCVWFRRDPRTHRSSCRGR